MDLTSCMSPRDILARQRHALRIVVQEATDNEAKRLAHLWSLRRKYNAVATATKSQSNVHSQSSSAIVRESSLSIEMDTNKSSPRREGLAFGTQDSPESRQTIEDAHHRILANEILEKSVSLVDNSLNGDDNTSLGIDISLSSYHHDGNSSDGDGLFMESSSQEYNQDSSHLNPSRLQQPDHPRIKEFEERYNEERKLEQLRITRLFEDYAALKNAFFHNEVDLKQKQQQYIEKINDKVKVLQSSTTAILSYPNRFTGLETNQQHKFYDTMCKKFEKDAHKHAASLNVKEKPSTIQEQRKLRLLRDKREILGKMINLQNREISEIHRINGGVGSLNRSNGLNSQPRHTYSESSLGRSWDSLSTLKELHVPASRTRTTRPINVPKLPLGHL